MRRREFIAALGGVAAWPLAARAQDAQRRVGVLMHYSDPKSDPGARLRVEALEDALQKLGWRKGLNLHIDYRWVGTDSGLFRVHAAELVRLKLDVIIAVSSPAVKALQRETQTVPIIFTQVSDPIGQGIVKSIARPGGNATGFTNYDPEIGGKWLELLKEAAPSLTRAAVIFNPQTAPYTSLYLRAMQAVAPSIQVVVAALPVRDDREIEAALAQHAREPGSGLIVMTDVFAVLHRRRLIELAERFSLPATYPYRYYVMEGGLMSYGVDQLDQYRGAASYLDRILKGERAGDLPVQTPTRFRLAINAKTAKGLGVPSTLLARADEVIE